jgi:hypothetical protein
MHAFDYLYLAFPGVIKQFGPSGMQLLHGIPIDEQNTQLVRGGGSAMQLMNCMHTYIEQVGREFNQEAYDKRIKTNEYWEKERCKIEADSSLLRKANRKESHEEFLRITNKRVYRNKLTRMVNNELQLHRLSLELRRDKYVR